tara:strand:- start:35769 stop:35903 length:135 start_codon:yes stop_codon:yes gene_type:complete
MKRRRIRIRIRGENKIIAINEATISPIRLKKFTYIIIDLKFFVF